MARVIGKPQRERERRFVVTAPATFFARGGATMVYHRASSLIFMTYEIFRLMGN
ncbi:MAG TPA: hypothetical protein P5239_09515 [Victivallales bacterium]|nr:hypothetical protein [Victivallales bacterium]HRU01926.1 hypothetical protein [Victivallales bacterium]